MSIIDHSVYQDLLSGRETKQILHIKKENQIIPHNFRREQKRQANCALNGCAQNFEFLLIPNQWIYPKYCEAHRNAFKRQHFLEQHGFVEDSL